MTDFQVIALRILLWIVFACAAAFVIEFAVESVFIFKRALYKFLQRRKK